MRRAQEEKPYIEKMAREKTHYELLGVGENVTQKEIKDAYRALVKSSHPDIDYQNAGKRNEATRQMTRLNEAYETLKDKRRRAEYDASIGINGQRRNPKVKLDEHDTVESRERFLKRIFHPARSTMVKVLGKYRHELKKLSEDIFDDALVAEFDKYLDSVENALRKAADAYSSEKAPSSLEPAVHMMRHAIAQAVDGLDETRQFCQNYNYDHLTMADNLFKISVDLSRNALQLTR